MDGSNIDSETVDGFGHEWSVYDQSSLPPSDSNEMFGQYFALFPWGGLPPVSEGFDLGCGSGRWARLAATRVGTLHCVDPSEAVIRVARSNLADRPNCRFHVAGVDHIPVPDGSMDFGYSLGVLHHVPDTEAGLRSCAAKLKPGAPFLVYLYYAFDNRPGWFRALWKATDFSRRLICRLPAWLKVVLTSVVAGVVYFPLARLARAAESLGFKVDGFPLSYYRNRSFYTMRTDALDRFGTRLERRFTREQIGTMMNNAGFRSVTFSPSQPYWCAVGYRRDDDAVPCDLPGAAATSSSPTA
jgi:ubiquinone/menaquinone biosynthesis C-methylase UbiE